MNARKKRECPDCLQMVTVNKTGLLRKHPMCGPLSDPAPTVEAPDAEESSMSKNEPGPWFTASYDGECATCDGAVCEGDTIRATGHGGYECTDCGEHPWAQNEELRQHVKAGAMDPVNDDAAPGFVAGPPAPAEVSHWQQQAREAAVRHLETLMSGEPNGEAAQDAVDRLKEEAAEALATMTPDAFMDPAPRGGSVTPATGVFSPDAFMDPAAPEETPAVNVSGQPDPRYEWWGEQNRGYLVKLPETGDFRRYKNGRPKGITRATTFNKAASDTTSLTDWKLRNVIIGASRRPDLLLRAHGLEVQRDSKVLNKLAAELEAVAGAKVGADIGTFLHEFCEHIDAGLKTWRDAPEVYQAQLKLYSETLAEAGFETVPGMIERTTYIAEFGGVVGRFDRILFHRPSGTYLIADLKTGRTMDYARLENECQEWIYAHGVNEHGVYDWNTDTWVEPHTQENVNVRLEVSETVGVIIHMPVQGDDAGQVILEKTDLQRGKRYAATCAENRGWVKPKRELWSWEPETVAEPRNWHSEFRKVVSRDQANALYKQAKAEGVPAPVLGDLVVIGKDALASLAKQDDVQ